MKKAPNASNKDVLDAVANTVVAVPARRVRGTNSALPSGTLRRYNNVLIPQLLELLGRQENPWDLQCISPAAEIQRLWQEIFPDAALGYAIQVNTPVYALVRILIVRRQYPCSRAADWSNIDTDNATHL